MSKTIPLPVAPVAALPDLWASFIRALRAEGIRERTIECYTDAKDAYVRFAEAHDLPTAPALIERQHVEEFLTDQIATRAANTARNRFRALSRFFNWLVDEEELSASPTARMKAPRVQDAPPEVLTKDELRRLLDAAKGRDLTARRDTAILWLLIDCGLRRGELAGLTLGDIDLDAGLVRVMGKGGRPRTVPMDAKTIRALDAYLRVRGTHRRAQDTDALWLGHAGVVTADGIAQIIRSRAVQAGITKRIHPHLFRHTWRHMLSADGASGDDVMRLAGWKSDAMLRRYGGSLADERAREAHRRHSPAHQL